MADDQVVIKKITIVSGGHHGGAWKVAFADFMTAMMAFFLVMWLLSQDAETKANIASYFSGPSMLEANFTSYGAMLTLEKLFLDLVNEPLGTLQEMLEPADFTPDILSMGSRGVILHYLAENLGEIADVDVKSDSVEFEIKDFFLFQLGTSEFSGQFTEVMKQIASATQGLENAILTVEVEIPRQQVSGGDVEKARLIARKRARLLSKFLKGTFEHSSNEVEEKVLVVEAKEIPPSGVPFGYIRFHLQQKSTLPDGTKPRKIESLFGDKDDDEDIYKDFVKRISNQKQKEAVEEKGLN